VVLNRPPTCLSRARHLARDGHLLADVNCGSAARAPEATKAAATAAVVPRTGRREKSVVAVI